MKVNFRFSNLCGSVYSGGNVLFTAESCVVTAVGNRITVFDVAADRSYTMSFESRKNIQTIAISPNGKLLLVVDEDGRAMLVNFVLQTVLHRQNFHEKVNDAQFSPNGRFIVLTHGKQIQFWRTPGFTEMEFAPMALHRSLAGPFDDVLSVRWSPDSKFVVCGCKDMTVRIYSTDPVEGFEPSILTGHRNYIIGAYFFIDGEVIYTVSKDGSLFVWRKEKVDEAGNSMIDDSEEKSDIKRRRKGTGSYNTPRKWFLHTRHYFNQNHAKVVSCDYHARTNLLVVGFSSGVFGIWELPDFTQIHTLSISQKKVDAITINPSGEWLALASSDLGQLLLWDWRSESYVLRQQGHHLSLNTLSYSSDGQYIATAGDDGKVKLWNTKSGYCFVTFPDHSASVQAVSFAGRKANVVVSASLDGTVRAFDLVRYRNFRTFTSPSRVQFGCVSVDSSGDLVSAGSIDTFEIYVWSMQTGNLVEVFSGHTGPVSSVQFSPVSGSLLTGSWDKSVRIWNVYGRDTGSVGEPLLNSSEVLAIAYRGDGKECAVACLDGQIQIWDVELHRQLGAIEGKKDVGGGRKSGDRITAANNTAGKHFTAVSYTVDGSYLLAGGNSKFVCIYHVASKSLLKRFQISHNLSFDGMHTELDSRNMTEAGPRELLDDTGDLSDLEDRIDKSVPGAKRGDLSLRAKVKPEVRTKSVQFSPSGRTWAAASTEGLLIYTLDDGILFDPFDLEIDITPESIMEALTDTKEYLRALVMAFRLGENEITQRIISYIPVSSADLVIKSLPHKYLERLLKALVFRFESVKECQELQLNLRWSLSALRYHGVYLKDRNQDFAGTLRGLVKGITRVQEVVSKVSNGNISTLSYLATQMDLQDQRAEPDMDFL